MLKMRIPLPNCFQQPVSGSASEPGLAWATMPATVWWPQVAGSVAAAASSACATSERMSETWQWGSTPQLSAPRAQSLWAAEGAVSSTLWWTLRMRWKRGVLR